MKPNISFNLGLVVFIFAVLCAAQEVQPIFDISKELFFLWICLLAIVVVFSYLFAIAIIFVLHIYLFLPLFSVPTLLNGQQNGQRRDTSKRIAELAGTLLSLDISRSHTARMVS